MQINDRELLARTLQAEAGNQGLPGMIAAGSVVMNRIGSGGYGSNLRDVILKPGQFSAWNSMTGYAGGEQGQDMTSMTPSAEAYKAADMLLAGGYEDPTGGATHYYNPAISQPKWGAGAGGSWTEIGDHLFGRADAGRDPNQGVAADAMRAIGRQPRGILAPQAIEQTETENMIPQDKPRGLLGSLGIQKMEEGAEGETGQRFYERDTFKDTAATLAQGFAALGGNQAVQKFAADVAGQRTEAKARNKTVEYLRANGRGDLADMIDQGLIGGKEAASVLLQQPKDDRTALMKNYEYAKQTGYEGSFNDFLRSGGGGGSVINVGGNQVQRVGDFAVVPDETSEAGVRFVPIPGSKAAQELQSDARRQAALDTQTGQTGSVIDRKVDSLVGMLEKGGIFDLPEAGIIGQWLGAAGLNQEARTFRNEIKAVQSIIAFDQLAKMRAASKTGAALGAVTERELDLLMSAYGSLDQSTDPKILAQNLRDIKRVMGLIESEPAARQFYYGGGGSNAAPTQSNGVSVGEPY